MDAKHCEKLIIKSTKNRKECKICLLSKKIIRKKRSNNKLSKEYSDSIELFHQIDNKKSINQNDNNNNFTPKFFSNQNVLSMSSQSTPPNRMRLPRSFYIKKHQSFLNNDLMFEQIPMNSIDNKLHTVDTDINNLNCKRFKRKSNLMAFKILLALMFHIGFILISILVFSHLESIHSKFSITSILQRFLFYSISVKYSKILFWTMSMVNFLVFLLILIFPKFRSVFPLNCLMFMLYTLNLAIFYSFLTSFYATSFFAKFYALILVGLVFMVIFCCQNKFTFYSVPYLPYFYVFFCTATFIVTFGLIRFYSIQLKIQIESEINRKINILNQSDFVEMIFSVLASFTYLFYILFDLQFILTSKSDSYQHDYLTAAFNLLTRDVMQMIFLMNSFLLSLIK